MTDYDGLLAAIIANPEEDTPRLMLADWLQENGQEPRAQFIRRQVEAARAEPYSREARTAAAAAELLLESHRGEWSRTVRQWVLAWRFERGFVQHAAVNVATFPRNATTLFAAEPIRSVQMTRPASIATTASLEPFFETPELAGVTRLDLTNLQLAPVEFDPLAASPYLGAVTDLCLRQTPVPPDWFASLLTSTALPALAGLDLADLSHLGLRLAETLPVLESRRFLRLDLSRIAFTSDQIQRVLASRCLREVEELRLAWMRGTTREGALRYLDMGWVIPWNRLRLLDLAAQGVGDSGVSEIVRELSRRPQESPLRWLGLANNELSAASVRTLASAPDSKLRLYYLDVRGNGFTLPQLAALQSRFPDAVIEN